MYIGVGIFLLLVGLVIVFAYNGDMSIAGLDVGALGWIAIALGVLAIILSFLLTNRRRETVVRDERRYCPARA